jgi:hypothetical protein
MLDRSRSNPCRTLFHLHPNTAYGLRLSLEFRNHTWIEPFLQLRQHGTNIPPQPEIERVYHTADPIARTKTITMPSKRCHILLIGGTGICGHIFTQSAIQMGHFVTIYARTPSNLPKAISWHDSVDVILGELEDEEELKRAAACGADTFISLAGPTMGNKNGTVGLVRERDDADRV